MNLVIWFGMLFAFGAEAVVIRDVPHVQQKPDFCGEACLEMALARLGVRVDQDAVFDHSGLDPRLGRGCYTRELAAAAKSLGFDVGDVFYTVDAGNPDPGLEAGLKQVEAGLAKGWMSILCMHYDDSPKTTEHFRLIVGYDPKTELFSYHEPAVKEGGYRTISRAKLKELWPLKYADDKWTVVLLTLKPVRLPKAEAAERFTGADYAQHIHALKAKLPAGFHIHIEEPFVVVGDEEPKVVEQRSKDTVRWAVDRLRRDYFSKDPDDVITVWLFRDNVSYETNAEQLFGKKPTTPYGYYSPSDRALVMNIATGGGTLVHELVHPFIHSNFLNCPSWFNEGLASLYEQASERDGHIIGLTNWRLKGLQTRITEGKLDSFKTLCRTTTHEFYDDGRGTNYAQARYLCYSLQERGLLVKFYHQFVRDVEKDPSGYETLKSVLGVEDLAAWQKEWETEVGELRFR
jgi:hypothetical protein